MFEESLVESAGLLRPRNHRSVVYSVAIQAAAAAALLSIPLVHPEVLPLHVPPMSLIAPMPKPPAPPPPEVRQPVHVENNSASLPTVSAPTPMGPRIVRTNLPSPSSDAPPVDATINIGGSGMPGPLTNFGLESTMARTRVVSVANGSGARPRISSGVSAGLLLAPIRPVYPAIARAARVEGTVMVQAIISKSGAVESAHAVSGPAMLQAAALEAVTRARYRPYLLNGEPTEVDTTFTVVFRLAGT